MNAIIIRFIFLITIVLSFEYCFSQNDTETYYLDRNQGLCVKDKAVFIAKGIQLNERFKLSYFILTTGKLIMEIMYTDLTLAIKDGLFTEYDENGQVKTKGNYANNKQEGYWIYWDQLHLTDSIFYEDGIDILSISYSYDQKDILNNRVLKDSKTKTLEITSFGEKGNVARHTKWIDGTGDQVYYYPNGHVKTIEKYENKKIVATKYYKPDGTEVSAKEMKKNEEKIMAGFRNQAGGTPEYPGGSAGFFSFFNGNFKASSGQGQERFSETVTVTFYLDKAGFAYNIHVSGARNREVESEIFSVFRRMPAWKMYGHQSFGPVTYTINISPN